MPRTLEDVRRWQQQGTELLLDVASSLSEATVGQASGLLGWSRNHLLAHVAANSDALQNLARWAATGEETPMYASPEARAAAIEKGSALPANDLVAWVRSSATRLEEALSGLDDKKWQVPVTTAQGRTVPASEIPWLRAREVFVHAVDLCTGLTFADLPTDFLTALREDIDAGRARAGNSAPAVQGPLPDVTAYLAGRPFSNVATPTGEPAPELAPWL